MAWHRSRARRTRMIVRRDPSRKAYRLTVEVLENRRLLASATVNDPGPESDGDISDGMCDTGSRDMPTGRCTLNAAIQTINFAGTLGTLTFAVNGMIDSSNSGEITVPVTISGGGTGLVVGVRGTAGNSMISGLTIADGGISLSGGHNMAMAVQSDNASISLEGGNNMAMNVQTNTGSVTLEGDGNTAQDVRTMMGILSLSGSNNTARQGVGGTINVGGFGSRTTGNLVENSFIGVMPDGTPLPGTGNTGLTVNSDTSTIRGNTAAGGPSVGITVQGSGNLVQGNFVGDTVARLVQ